MGCWLARRAEFLLLGIEVEVLAVTPQVFRFVASARQFDRRRSLIGFLLKVKLQPGPLLLVGKLRRPLGVALPLLLPLFAAGRLGLAEIIGKVLPAVCE